MGGDEGMARWKNWQTREFLRLTKLVHDEFRSIRRVTAAAYEPMDDAEWCANQIDTLDPRLTGVGIFVPF